MLPFLLLFDGAATGCKVLSRGRVILKPPPAAPLAVTCSSTMIAAIAVDMSCRHPAGSQLFICVVIITVKLVEEG
jgi:hypothetical protein